MGHTKHHIIVVTSWKDELIEKAHLKAKIEFGGLVSEKVQSAINVFTSFFIAPDGSMEGWEESHEYDCKRKRFIEWMESQKYEDGSSSLSYCEVLYGDDYGECGIVSHN